MTTDKQRMFVTNDGRNVLFTFALVSSLFLLWGFCNGMIGVMDKHFQEELGLTLAQSAWVQFAHYLGYFLMAIPAGWLATRLGYKGGIIAGLLLVAAGGFWLIPSTNIAEFWAFLLGVCAIAAGLTFLETVANPYTTVLGSPRYAATRINLAQSCNGVGWILGPIAGGMFFYGTDAEGMSTGSETLWIPYAGVAVVVLLLAVAFFFSPVPDIPAEDDYNIRKKGENEAASEQAERQASRVKAYILLWFNAVVLVGVFGMCAWVALNAFDVGPQLVDFASQLPLPSGVSVSADNALLIAITAGGVVVSLVLAFVLVPVAVKISHHSIWSHPHFSGAVVAQFFYVAAQAGIFSFVINYMVWEVPPLPNAWRELVTANAADTGKGTAAKKQSLIEVKTRIDKSDIKQLPSLVARLNREGPDPVVAFVRSQLSKETLASLATYRSPDVKGKLEAEYPSEEMQESLATFRGEAADHTLRFHLARDLEDLVTRDMRKSKTEPKPTLYDESRFAGFSLLLATRQLIAQDPKGNDRCRLNRMLLADAFPDELPFRDGILCFSNRAASFLATLGFICFLTGRFSGALLLRKVSAHKIVGLYGTLNILMCYLVFAKLGWLSVLCVFLSYFFMSIMFPTIFALGIFGLGERAKFASAFIVMAIMGGAMLPKAMGAVADRYDMSRSFIVPLACFVVVALYGFGWPLLSKAKSLHGAPASGGH